MRSDLERKELLERVQALYPQGCTTAKDMVQTFSKQGIWGVSVTRVSLLTRQPGKNNFIVGYLATEYVDQEGEMIYDPFEGKWIFSHPTMGDIQQLSGPVNKLGRINLHNHPNSGLIPGKINPLDISRLGVRTYKAARHFFISPNTTHLAEEGVDVVLPGGADSFEIRTLQEVVEGLQEQLINRRWTKVHLVGQEIATGFFTPPL